MGDYWRNMRTIPIANGLSPVRWDGPGLRRHSIERTNKRTSTSKNTSMRRRIWKRRSTRKRKTNPRTILKILNKTIAAADTTRVKDFLPADRIAYYRSELFAIREEVLELIKELRSR